MYSCVECKAKRVDIWPVFRGYDNGDIELVCPRCRRGVTLTVDEYLSAPVDPSVIGKLMDRWNAMNIGGDNDADGGKSVTGTV